MRNIHCLEIIQYNTIILFSVNLSGNKVLVEIQTQLKYTFSLHAIKSVKNTLYSAGRPEGAQLLFYFAPPPPPPSHTHTHTRPTPLSTFADQTHIQRSRPRRKTVFFKTSLPVFICIHSLFTDVSILSPAGGNDW